MTHLINSNNSIPPKIQQTLSIIGERIQSARKKRRLTMNDMASRMFITRKTLSRIEKGEGSVSLSVFAQALWVLGMDDQLLTLADPAKDSAGLFLERQRLPKRVRKSMLNDRLDF